MNSELEQRLVRYLDKLEVGLDKAIDLSSEQVPLVIQEIINYGWYCNIFAASVFLSLIAALVLGRLILLKPGSTFLDANKSDDVIGSVFAVLVIGMFLSIGLAVPICELFQIYFAPRLYVLEQIQQMVN